MNHPSRGKPRSNVDAALEDSFPASDPPAWNMGRDTPRSSTPSRKPRKTRRRTGSAAARSRVKRADVREDARARERQVQGRAMPRGRLMLSPVAWLRWLLRRTVRPAERRF